MTAPLLVPVVCPACDGFGSTLGYDRNLPCGGCNETGRARAVLDPDSREALELAYGRAMKAWFTASDSGDDVTAMLIWAEDVEPAEKALRSPTPSESAGRET